MQTMGNSVQKRGKKEHPDWLINKGTHTEPIRLELLTGQTTTKQNGSCFRNVFGENKNMLIHVKYDRYKENNKDIS